MSLSVFLLSLFHSVCLFVSLSLLTVVVSLELPSEQAEVTEDLYDELYEVLETEPVVVSQTTARIEETQNKKSPTFAPSSRSRTPSGRFIYRGGGSKSKLHVVYLVVSVLSYLAY